MRVRVRNINCLTDHQFVTKGERTTVILIKIDLIVYAIVRFQIIPLALREIWTVRDMLRARTRAVTDGLQSN